MLEIRKLKKFIELDTQKKIEEEKKIIIDLTRFYDYLKDNYEKNLFFLNRSSDIVQY
jgi:hypothetical protein